MLIDNQPLSYGNLIVDWQLGDDRIFQRNVPAATLVPGDSLTDGYLTLKTSPTATDAYALVQKHVTQTPSTAGFISGSPPLSFTINVFSADYQGLVSAGTVVYYDMRVITAVGNTLTVETGTIEFQQNVTQVNKSGVPATFPNDGQPRFRGFATYQPDQIPFNIGLFNTGDFYMNANPLNGQGAGWQCLIGGSPGTWAAFLPAEPGGFVFLSDPHFKGYAFAPPTSGVYVAMDYFLNENPQPMAPEGWVCTTGGSPGTWKTKGIIGD